MKRTLWLTRDKDNIAGGYNIHRTKKSAAKMDNGLWVNILVNLCAREFEHFFPDCTLKPGEGPVKITVEITKV